MPRSLCLVLFALFLLSHACDSAENGAPREQAEGETRGARDASSSGAKGDARASGPARDAGRMRGEDDEAEDEGSPDADRDRGDEGDDAGGGDTGGAGPSSAESASALQALARHLALPAPRPSLAQQAFANVPLTRADAAEAKTLLWEDLARTIEQTRAGEVGASESVARTIPGERGLSLRYYLARRGGTPATGRSLFISMHGGGSAPSATNDSQWKNQIALVSGYDPKDAIWVAPRAPVDDWNMWFVEGIDALFERLIADMIVFEGVDPNRVYLTGYSAGGDGVYQLGPRMAERWAGAAMSAGHPNSASPLNLRNVPFAIHVGGADTAFERNLKAAEWGKWLEMLAADDPGGYLNQWKVHAGLPHWMELADAVSIPFLQSHTRDPYPSKVVWRQAELTRPHLYWLAVDAQSEKSASEVRASYSGQEVTITGVKQLARLTLRLADEMLDLDLPVRVTQDGTSLYEGKVTRTIAVLARTLEERSDPAMMFSGELTVTLR